ncbi:MAG: hypothetical protein IKG87_02640 [Clostridia bacterium]|nr:hypothetical protein [Clostridia bacterium]
MKKSPVVKILSILTVAALLLGALSFTVFAAAEQAAVVEQPEPVEQNGPRFGMTMDEVKALLGDWDEEDAYSDEFTIVRYQNAPFHDRFCTYALLFRSGALYMWMYGIQEDGVFEEVESEMTALYGESTGDTAPVISVFSAMNDIPLDEQSLQAAVDAGAMVYRCWNGDDGLAYVLMKIQSGQAFVTVFACLQP